MIEKWLKNLLHRYRLYIILEGFINYNAVVLSVIVLSAMLDNFLPMPLALREKFVLLLIVLTILFVLLLASRLYGVKTEIIVRLATRKAEELKDDLINAYSLSGDTGSSGYYSEQLKDKYIEFVSGRLDGIDFRRIVNFKNLLNNLKYLCIAMMVFAAAALMPIPNIKGSLGRLFNPKLSSEIGQFIKLQTGDLNVPWGGEALIKLRIIKMPSSKITVTARKEKGDWLVLKPAFEDSNKMLFKIANITEKWFYKAQVRDLYTDVYNIEPVALPQIARHKFHYYYPQYSGMPERISENDIDICALKGTRVVMDFWFNKPVVKAALRFSTGSDAPLNRISEEHFSREIVLDRDAKAAVDMVDKNGMANPEPVEINIKAENDAFPAVSMLAPNEDIISGTEADLPLTFEVSDDYGINLVALRYRKTGQPDYEKKIIKRYSPGMTGRVDDFIWRFADYSFSGGDVIEYYLEVFDNDVISGPKSAATSKYTLEMTSFDKEHRMIEEDLKQWRQQLMGILGDQIHAKAAAEKLADSGQVTETETEDLAKMQENINGGMDTAVNQLDRMLDRMEKDPLSSYQILSEHRMMNSSLRHLKNNAGTNALSSIKQKDFPAACADQQRIISELEKMGLLSEDLFQYQKMKDLLESADSMNDKADELLNNLEGLENLEDSEKMRELANLLSQVNDLMREVAKQIQDLPKDLPEEFVNQESIQELDFNRMSDLASNLQKALTKGDLKSAVEYAKSLLENIRNMLKTMDEVGLGIDGQRQPDALDKELGRSFAELDQIIIEQSDVLGQVKKIEQERLKSLFKKEEEMLKKLAERQKKVVKETDKIIGILSESGNYSQEIYALDGSLEYMKKVLAELEELKITNSRTYLADITAKLLNVKKSAQKKGLSEKNKNAHEKIKFLYEEEKDMLDELNRSDESMGVDVDEKDKKHLKELSGLQKKLQGRTKKLGSDLQDISRKTAQLEPELFENLDNASEEMGSASESMRDGDSKSAEISADKAMDCLTNGRGRLKQAMESVSKMKGQSGMPMPGFFSKQPGGAVTGVKGAFDGYVPIPGKEDYIPPKEFREEILNSLKEKFPETYKDLIREYYRRLSE